MVIKNGWGYFKKMLIQKMNVDDKSEKIVAILVVLGVCLLRISMAAAQIFFGVATAAGLYFWYRNSEKIAIAAEIKKYIIAACIFFLTTVFSAVGSDNPSAVFLFALNIWLWRFMVFLLIVCFVKKRKYLGRMLICVLLVFGVDGILSLYQFASHSRPFRGYGFSGNPLELSAIISMILPVLVVILLDQRFGKNVKIVAVFGLVGAIAELFGGWSRAAWLVSFIVVSFSGFWYVRKKAKAMAVALIILCSIGGVMFALPHYTDRLATTFNTQLNGPNMARIRLWQFSIKAFKERPVNGIGLGNWKRGYFNYKKHNVKNPNLIPHAHNNYLQILSETGIIGLLGFLYFNIYFLYTSFKNWLFDFNPYDLLVFTTFLSMIVLFGNTDFTLDSASVSRTFWFLLAVLLQLKQTDPELQGSQHA